MKRTTCALALAVLTVILTGCGGGGGSAVVSTGSTMVTLKFGQARTVSQTGELQRTASAIPAHIRQVKITIAAPDIVKIERMVEVAGKDSVTESFDVPNGLNRLFLVEGLDEGGVVLYRGEAYANLAGTPLALAITMISSDPLPPAFNGLSGISGVTSSSVVLTWQPSVDTVTPPERVQYLIYMATSRGAQNFSQPTFTTLPGRTSLEVTGLAPGTVYYFVVRAMDEKGNVDANTVELSARTLIPPDNVAPVFGGLVSVSAASSSEAVLTWEPATDNVTPGSDIVYLVFMATSSGAQNLAAPSYITAPGVTSFTVGGLTTGATYYFIVRARDAAGNIDHNMAEKSAAPPDQTPPQFRGLISAVAASSTQVDLLWEPASDNVSQPGGITYLIYVSASRGRQDFSTPSYTTQPGATHYSIEGLTPGTTSYYVVRARDAAGNIDSNRVERHVTTPVPSDTTPPVFGGLVSATASGSTVTLTWNPATDNVGLARYNVYVATAPGGQNFATPTLTASPSRTSVTYAAPQLGMAYYFVVRAQDTSGNIDNNTIERSVFIVSPDTTPPVFGGVVSATALSQTSGGLTWNAATDNISPSANIIYLIYMAAAPGGQNFGVPSYTTTPGATAYTLTGLSPNSSYYVVVRAVDEAGNIDGNTVEGSFATPPAPDVLPPVFGGLVSAAAAGTNITLSWNPATDNVGVAQYNVYVATTPGGQNFAAPAQTAAAASTSAIYSAPQVAMTYYFVVRAQDTSGNIDTNTVERSVFIPDVTPPVFGGGSVSAVGSTFIRLSWTPATDNVTPPSGIVYPIYQASTPCGQNFAAPSYTTAPGASLYDVTGLNPATSEYYFVVRAQDAAGNIDANTVKAFNSTINFSVSSATFNATTGQIDYVICGDGNTGVPNLQVYIQYSDICFSNCAPAVISQGGRFWLDSCTIEPAPNCLVWSITPAFVPVNIRVTADPLNSVTEFNETDNCFATTPSLCTQPLPATCP